MKLKDKAAVITGASMGYGMAIAEAFARQGADLVLASRGFDKLKTVADQISGSTGQKVEPVATDITIKAEVDALFQKAVDMYGKIDILVNNAGIYPPSSIVDMKEEEMDAVFNLNLKGTFLCTQAAVKRMIEQNKGGKIVNVASMQGRAGIPGYSIYSASKGGIIAATRSWAAELAPHNIQVNGIAYGVFPSEEFRKMFPPEFWQTIIAMCPKATQQGDLGAPEDVTPIAVFLASADSDWTTGQTISWDGGMTMP